MEEKTLRERVMISSELEDAMEWHKWREEIPYLDFPNDWKIKIIPPFCGAVIRFLVSHKQIKDSWVSVYLDCYDHLGYMEEPYWEIYPCDDGSCQRYLMNETEGLLQGIGEALKKQSEASCN